MAYPYIARRQDMKQEPSDELVSRERHGLLTVIVCIIPPEERDLAVQYGEDAVIADGDPVGISAKVLKDTLDAIEGRFAIDDPLLIIEMSPEGFEGSGFLEMADAAGEYEIAPCEAFFEKVKELPSEQRRHDPYGNEEAFTAWHPSASVRGQPTPGDNTVDVGMFPEVLTPGVQNTNDPYLCTEMLWVICEFRECLGCGAKK